MSGALSIFSRASLPSLSEYGSSSTRSVQAYVKSTHVNELLLALLLVIQCSLLHPAFAHSKLARLLRNGLTPINFIWCFTSPFQASAKPASPLKSFGDIFNSVIYIYMAIKSLEWGFAAESYYIRRLTIIDGVKRWQKPNGNDDSYKKKQEEEPLDVTKLAAWIFLQFTSLRGLQFTWGPSIAGNTQTTSALLWRLFCVNIPLTCASGFIALSRDSPLGTPASALMLLGTPNFPGLSILSEALYSACFGIWLACSLDTRYTVITLGMTIIHWFATMIRCPQHILDLCDPMNFPPMFNSPHKASSIAHFWREGWHTGLQRFFLIAGGKPMVWITKKIGASSQTQRLAGLFGVFAASALVHEYPPYSWNQGKDSTFSKSQSLPGALFFFMMQPVAILIEPYLIPLVPEKLGGGVLWVWVFSLLTAYPFRKQYLEERGMAAIFTPVSQWSWLYILSPVKN